MNENKIAELVLAYLEKDTTPQEREHITRDLAALGYNVAQLAALQKTQHDLLDLPTPSSGNRMADRFYRELADQMHNTGRRSRKLSFTWPDWRLLPRLVAAAAFSLLLLFIGWNAGKMTSQPGYQQQLTQMSGEIRDMKQMFTLTLLQHPSQVERLQGISQVSSLDTVNTAIIHALLTTLNSDPNTDVRLVTVRTLSRFSYLPEVRSSLVHAIGEQQDPQVLLLLADVMVSLHESRSVPSLQQLLVTQDLNADIRDKIEKSILVLL